MRNYCKLVFIGSKGLNGTHSGLHNCFK